MKMYKTMVLLDCFDRRMTEAQQSGLISFYLTSHGEEACQVGSAAALLDQDLIFPQYREAGKSRQATHPTIFKVEFYRGPFAFPLR